MMWLLFVDVVGGEDGVFVNRRMIEKKGEREDGWRMGGEEGPTSSYHFLIIVVNNINQNNKNFRKIT